MAYWPLKNSWVETDSAGQNLSDSSLTQVVPASNAYGAWVEFIANTAANSDMALVHLEGNSSNERAFDIGIGSAGNEEAIVSEFVTHPVGSKGLVSVEIPVQIPSGQRVAMRLKSVSSQRDANMGIQLFANGWNGVSNRQRHFGENLDAGGRGVAGVVTSTAHSKTAWTEYIASTTEDMHGFWVLCTVNTSSHTIGAFMLDLAVGSVGNEELIAEDLFFKTHNQEFHVSPFFIPVYIPAGTRISFRHQTTITSGTANSQPRISIMGAN